MKYWIPDQVGNDKGVKMGKKIIDYLSYIMIAFLIGLFFTFGVRTGKYLWPEEIPDLVVKHQWETP